VYVVDVDERHAIIEFALDGPIRQDEMQKFVEELKAAAHSLRGRSIKLMADLRTFRPFSPEVAELILQAQRFVLQRGAMRMAEMVDSHVLLLQLNRVARESGAEKILRRFSSDFSAKHWLIHGDEERALA
jgi:hypothetical protein